MLNKQDQRILMVGSFKVGK